MYVLDTNVVSELRKIRAGKADMNVAAWADSVDATELFLSVISLQELEIGVLLAERRDPSQGAILRAWLNSHVMPAFNGRILDVDTAVAQRSARLHVPDPRPVRDGGASARDYRRHPDEAAWFVRTTAARWARGFPLVGYARRGGFIPAKGNNFPGRGRRNNPPGDGVFNGKGRAARSPPVP